MPGMFGGGAPKLFGNQGQQASNQTYMPGAQRQSGGGGMPGMQRPQRPQSPVPGWAQSPGAGQDYLRQMFGMSPNATGPKGAMGAPGNPNTAIGPRPPMMTPGQRQDATAGIDAYMRDRPRNYITGPNGEPIGMTKGGGRLGQMMGPQRRPPMPPPMTPNAMQTTGLPSATTQPQTPMPQPMQTQSPPSQFNGPNMVQGAMGQDYTGLWSHGALQKGPSGSQSREITWTGDPAINQASGVPNQWNVWSADPSQYDAALGQRNQQMQTAMADPNAPLIPYGQPGYNPSDPRWDQMRLGARPLI